MWRRLAVICGLSAVAFVAPILDLYGRNPEVFVANRSSVLEIVVFALIVALVIAVVSWAVLAIAGAVSERAQEVSYRVVIGLLALATGLVVSRQVMAENTVGAVIIALVVAGLVYWLATSFDLLFRIGAVVRAPAIGTG